MYILLFVILNVSHIIIISIHVSQGSKFCSYVLETVGIRVNSGYIVDFAQFNVGCSSKNCLSARCPSAANIVSRDIGVIGAKIVFPDRILSVFFILKY